MKQHSTESTLNAIGEVAPAIGLLIFSAFVTFLAANFLGYISTL